MKKRTYVKYSDIEKLQEQYNPNFIILYGGRNDGKSYAAKEKVLRDFFHDGSTFTYLRRYSVDIKDVDNRDYWTDFITDTTGRGNKITELSGGLYNDIECEKNKIYLALTDNEKTTRGPLIGYIHALSAEGRLKSLQFPDVETIIYEEFCSTSFLYNEVTHFMNYVSTICRDRRITVLLIGNTITRQNVFFREWELNNIDNQQPGTVDIYRFKQDAGEVIVAAYYTCTTKDNNMFFGQAAKMITGGEWESQEQPHLSDNESMYNEIYRMTFETDQLNRFLMRFLINEKGDMGLWYVTKRTSEIKPNERIISPDLKESALYTADFFPLSQNEQRLFQYIKMGRIAYGDNLTGTEFKRAMKQLSFINNSI